MLIGRRLKKDDEAEALGLTRYGTLHSMKCGVCDQSVSRHVRETLFSAAFLTGIRIASVDPSTGNSVSIVQRPSAQHTHQHFPTGFVSACLTIMSLTNCRFYEEKYPDIDSLVVVSVNKVRYCPTTRCENAY